MDGEVKYDDSTSIAAFRNAETARWTRESFQRLKGAIVSAFVIIARPAPATPSWVRFSREKSKVYERTQWTSVATILLQIEDIMFQSYEEIAKVKRVRQYIDKRQNLQLGDGDNFPCTSFIFSKLKNMYA